MTNKQKKLNTDAKEVPVSDIALKLGFDGLTKEEQEALLERIGAMVLQAVLVRALSLMSEEDAKDFQLLLDSGGEEEDVLGFLRSRVPEFDDIAYEEAERFRTDTLAALNAQPQASPEEPERVD